MIEECTRFTVDTETLSGRFIRPDDASTAPTLLFLHGIGRVTQKSFLPFATHLADKQGISSFKFDFSGHGESTGTMRSSSLQKRATEALAAIDHARMNAPITVCAYSMGCHVALSLLDCVPIGALILFCPAIYPDEAERATFNSQFHKFLGEGADWKSSRLFDRVGRFRGTICVVFGEKDQIVPAGVVDALRVRSTVARQKHFIAVPEGTHVLLKQLYNSPDLLNQVSDVIATPFG